MHTAWIYPVGKRCGISFYAQEYIKYVQKFVPVTSCDIAQCLASPHRCSDTINTCDLVHVHYETSFFLNNNSKRFAQLCAAIKKPIVVTVHEVYENFPGVFPRSRINGNGVVKYIKQKMYDIRHPYQTLYTKHCHNHFYASCIFVHHQYHKQILINKNIPASLLRVLPHPVPFVKIERMPFDTFNGTIHLASTGFINPQYDYELLFAVLSHMSVPWHFTWIGGVRSSEDNDILLQLEEKIRFRKWESNITITGWVSVEQQNRLLQDSHIYLALLKNRSSSGSIAAAIGNNRLITATSIPLTRELIQYGPLLMLVDRDPVSIAQAIKQLTDDASLREQYVTSVTRYRNNCSFEKMSGELVKVYKELV